MVTLDEEAPDLLVLRYMPPHREADEADYLAALVSIGARREPFALLAVLGGGGHLSPAGERAQALWFKTTRKEMNQTCRALAMVRPLAAPEALEHSALVFGRLWSFPLRAFGTEAAARVFLREIVA